MISCLKVYLKIYLNRITVCFSGNDLILEVFTMSLDGLNSWSDK